MSANTSPLQYKTKLSSALLYSFGFIVFTVGLIYIAVFDADEPQVSPSLLLILAFFVGLYIKQVADRPPQSKKAYLSLTIGSLLVTLLCIILFPKVTLLVIGVGLFGMLGSYYIWINVITRQPIIQADEHALWLHNGVFRGKSFAVRWENVEKLSLHDQPILGGSKRTFIGARLKDVEAFLQSNSAVKSKMLRRVINSNMKMHDSHILADVSNIEVEKPQLIQELEQLQTNATHSQSIQ